MTEDAKQRSLRRAQAQNVMLRSMVEQLHSNCCGFLWGSASSTRVPASSDENNLGSECKRQADVSAAVARWEGNPRGRLSAWNLVAAKLAPSRHSWFLNGNVLARGSQKKLRYNKARSDKPGCLDAGRRRDTARSLWAPWSTESGSEVYTWLRSTSRTMHKDNALTGSCRRRCRQGRCAAVDA